MMLKQSNVTSSSEEVAAFDGSIGNGEREHIVVSYGSAEEESVASYIPHQRWSKKDKALTVGVVLLIVGAVAFAVAVYRPGGLGNSSIHQSSQGQIFTSEPTYYPTYMPTDLQILEGATSFQTSTKADKGDGEGEVPGNKPIVTFQNSADGSGELPPAPTPPAQETYPFMTPFPMDTPIPTSMPSYAATESITSTATGRVSGEGTVTVSTETTGPPTLPIRDPV
ncbi:hypothetical protein ACHAWT_002736 [Skeletonema menzelii]